MDAARDAPPADSSADFWSCVSSMRTSVDGDAAASPGDAAMPPPDTAAPPRSTEAEPSETVAPARTTRAESACSSSRTVSRPCARSRTAGGGERASASAILGPVESGSTNRCALSRPAKRLYAASCTSPAGTVTASSPPASSAIFARSAWTAPRRTSRSYACDEPRGEITSAPSIENGCEPSAPDISIPETSPGIDRRTGSVKERERRRSSRPRRGEDASAGASASRETATVWLPRAPSSLPARSAKAPAAASTRSAWADTGPDSPKAPATAAACSPVREMRTR